MAHPIITVISSLSTDHQIRADGFPGPGESIIASDIFIRCGGKGANTSMAASRLSRKNPGRGNHASRVNHDLSMTSRAPAPSPSIRDQPVQVRMIGAVGHDEERGGMDTRGLEIVNQLQKSGVDTSGVRVAPGKLTGLCTWIMDTETGENRLVVAPGANLHLQPNDFLTPGSLAGGYRPDLVVCHLTIPTETTKQILKTARSNGISTLLNPSPARDLPDSVYENVSHLIVNGTEAAILAGMRSEELSDIEGWREAADVFLDKGVENVVLTLGSKGAFYSNLDNDGHVKAEKDVNVVDVTGAGDTFTGAYAVEFVRQKHMGVWDIRKAVEVGCKAAARTVQGIGAQETIPWSDDL